MVGIRRWHGKGYRAGAFSVPPTLSVTDLINYEGDELGNDAVKMEAEQTAKILGIDLKTISVRNALWVTKTKRQALRYGDKDTISEINYIDGWVVLFDGGEEGSLVLNLGVIL